MADDDRGDARPKTAEVVATLRAFPTEIERDLDHYHHRDIADWWTGDLTSRKLWAFIAHFPDDSATKKAMREGDWSEQQYILARVANELAYLRADHAAVHAQHRMRVDPIESPAQRAERAERKKAQEAIRSMILAQLSGEYVPEPRHTTFVSEESTRRGGAHG